MPSPVASIQYLGHFKSESLYKPFSHLLLSAIAKEKQKNATVKADIFVRNSMLANYKLICEHSMFLTHISRHDSGKYLLTFLKDL